MITSFIQGGLGNQLFQIAAGYSLADRLDTSFALHHGQHWLPLQGNRIETYKDNILSKINFEDLSNIKFTRYDYTDAKHLPIPLLDNQILVGYFQSQKYFSSCKDKIKELFTLKLVDMPKGSVSLHIRRGDYLSNPSIHPTMSADYYKKALQSIGSYSEVFVFTDSDLPEGLEDSNITVVSEGTDYEQMGMMASCTHNVIANSTFSWWAAYLNQNNGVVVAPKTWYGPKGPKDWQDIYCDNWVVI